MSSREVTFDGATMAEFAVQQELSRNSTGAVLKAVYKRDGRTYALKRKNIGESISHTAVQTEVKLLEQLNHPNVVKCFGSFWDDDTRALHIVLEFCDGGDLRGLINRHKGIGIHLDESFIWRTFDQICAGLTHLHQNGIVHRDIKSMNILLTDNGQTVKITDLGVSRQVSENTILLKTLYGTPLYLSPEIVSGQEYNEKTDIWSLGIILYELCALVTPFHGKSLLALAQAINEGKLDPIPNLYSQPMKDFIVWILTMDFNSRPSIVEVTRRRSEMMKAHNGVVSEVRERVRTNAALDCVPTLAPRLVSGAAPEQDDDSAADTISVDDADSDSEDSLNVPRVPISKNRPVRESMPPQPPDADIGNGQIRHSLFPSNAGGRVTDSSTRKVVPIGAEMKTEAARVVLQAAWTGGRDLKLKAEGAVFPSPSSHQSQELLGDFKECEDQQVPINKDRLQACIRRQSQLLRRLLKYRTFSTGSAENTFARNCESSTKKLEDEVRRLSDLLLILDRAAVSGTLSVAVARSLHLYNTVRETGNTNAPQSCRSDKEGKNELYYRHGHGSTEATPDHKQIIDNGGGGGEVHVLDYFQLPRPKKDAFASNVSNHQLFDVEKKGKLGTNLASQRKIPSSSLNTSKVAAFQSHPVNENNCAEESPQLKQKTESNKGISTKIQGQQSLPVKNSTALYCGNNIFDDRPIEPVSSRYQRRPHSAILSAATRHAQLPLPPSGKTRTIPSPEICSRGRLTSHDRSENRDGIQHTGTLKKEIASSVDTQDVYRAQRRQRDGGVNNRGFLFDGGDGTQAVFQNISPILGGNERGDSRENRRRAIMKNAKEHELSELNLEENEQWCQGGRRRTHHAFNVITGKY